MKPIKKINIMYLPKRYYNNGVQIKIFARIFMEKKLHKLSVSRTAVVAIQGNTENPTYIWLITHGYGYLAEYFIDKFIPYLDGSNLLIVPEALSRFYKEGMQGRVGASWMTSHHRSDEIDDYCNYLEVVYQNYISPYKHAKIVLLGFSQGLATISRWHIRTEFRCDFLVGWGAAFPEEVVENKKIYDVPTIAMIGLQDEFISETIRNQYLKKIKDENLPIYPILYEGKHDIDSLALQKLVDKLATYKDTK